MKNHRYVKVSLCTARVWKTAHKCTMNFGWHVQYICMYVHTCTVCNVMHVAYVCNAIYIYIYIYNELQCKAIQCILPIQGPVQNLQVSFMSNIELNNCLGSVVFVWAMKAIYIWYKLAYIFVCIYVYIMSKHLSLINVARSLQTMFYAHSFLVILHAYFMRYTALQNTIAIKFCFLS